MKATQGPEYDALIQDEEEECSLNCGCRMFRPYGDNSVAISFCRTHKDGSVDAKRRAEEGIKQLDLERDAHLCQHQPMYTRLLNCL